MIFVVPWVIAGAGIGICLLWRNGAPDWVAGRENRHSDFGYTVIAIIFGGGALFAERETTGYSEGYIIETGALLAYWMICRGIMGGPQS